jgi:phospholipid-transporting ATPase
LAWFIQLLTFWVAYSHLIPISLYVIIEMLKLSQARIIGKDVRMYDTETEQFALCRNSDLIEELGQVDFVFSDKTGTLTQNKMIFKKCSVNNQIFGQPLPADTPSSESMAESSIQQIVQLISNPKDKLGEQLSEFFTMLAVCHTCTVE